MKRCICGLTHDDSVLTCDCGHDLSDTPKIKATYNSVPVGKTDKSSGSIRSLRLLSWINFIASIISAIYINLKLGNRTIEYGYRVKEVVDPYWVSVSVALIIQGLFVMLFALVLCQIAENIIDLKNR